MSPQSPQRLLFLPGASGDTTLWAAVDQRLLHPAERRHLGWPGFGPTPPNPRVQGFEDLLALVLAELDRPCALIAQSMGGVLALRAALERPGQVTHLVLSVTSGGVAMAPHGAEHWRETFQAAHPELPDWFATHDDDLAPRLPALAVPTLLLWGDADPISPPSVGAQLNGLLPQSRLVVIAGGDHDLAHHHADRIAPLVDAHLVGAGLSDPGLQDDTGDAQTWGTATDDSDPWA